MEWTHIDEASEASEPGNRDDFLSKSQIGKHYENRKY